MPIGLSHILLNQLCVSLGAAVLCHLFPAFPPCWKRVLADRKTLDCACWVKKWALRKAAGRAARKSVLGAGMVRVRDGCAVFLVPTETELGFDLRPQGGKGEFVGSRGRESDSNLMDGWR